MTSASERMNKIFNELLRPKMNKNKQNKMKRRQFTSKFLFLGGLSLAFSVPPPEPWLDSMGVLKRQVGMFSLRWRAKNSSPSLLFEHNDFQSANCFGVRCSVKKMFNKLVKSKLEEWWRMVWRQTGQSIRLLG